ncbi:cupin domain-containing protein [Rhizobium sp. RCC_161_2]|uniref:cupin domain-containing protein n=1 Tax=Rhizobium sp. RCC_161_2 TaxID=3239219 RepID=UPI003526A3F4
MPHQPLLLTIVAENEAIQPLPPYPEMLSEHLKGREKRSLGDPFGLSQFGVNLTSIAPGSHSSLHHRHSHQDEFIFVLKGTLTLVSDGGEAELRPGMCAGFKAGGAAHHLENRENQVALLLEVGDRTACDVVEYPLHDLMIDQRADGSYRFCNKQGIPY